MNRYSLEYKLYQTILESNITDRQRDLLFEANILQRFRDWFGAVGDWANSPLGSMFSDAKLGRRMQTSITNVKKEMQQLRGLAKEAGKNESQVLASFLDGIMASEKITNRDLQAAKGEGPSGKGSTGEIPEEELPPGTKVQSSDKQQLVHALAQILSDVLGKPMEDVAEEANKKKINVTGLINAVSNGVAKHTELKDVDKIKKIIGVLFEKGHIETQ